jgi:hypothetical protein
MNGRFGVPVSAGSVLLIEAGHKIFETRCNRQLTG